MKPSIIVLLGITGDLAKRKIVPALYRLFRDELINPDTRVIGTSRHETEPQTVIDELRKTLEDGNESVDEAAITKLTEQLSMATLDPTDSEQYGNLKRHITEIGQTNDSQLLFYLSLPPQVYSKVIIALGKANFAQARLLVEKPFGYDLTSAQELINTTAEHFAEDHVYRIDHYLAKETAQNMLRFRSQNPLFAGIWSGQHIRSVTVTASESIGIEGRADFYDNVGALRDVVQSHLMQLLAVTLMDTSDNVHNSRQAVLSSLTQSGVASRGQYEGYRAETGKSDSMTETYADIHLQSGLPQWAGVRIRLITGKALKSKYTSINICFDDNGKNSLEFRIQPDEGINLKLQVKQPGLDESVVGRELAFEYQNVADGKTLEAYERVLIDAIRGDRTLFASSREVIASWEALQPILDSWQQSQNDLLFYAPGTDTV